MFRQFCFGMFSPRDFRPEQWLSERELPRERLLQVIIVLAASVSMHSIVESPRLIEFVKRPRRRRKRCAKKANWMQSYSNDDRELMMTNYDLEKIWNTLYGGVKWNRKNRKWFACLPGSSLSLANAKLFRSRRRNLCTITRLLRERKIHHIEWFSISNSTFKMESSVAVCRLF